jgi:hypothetical protein
VSPNLSIKYDTIPIQSCLTNYTDFKEADDATFVTVNESIHSHEPDSEAIVVQSSVPSSGFNRSDIIEVLSKHHKHTEWLGKVTRTRHQFVFIRSGTVDKIRITPRYLKHATSEDARVSNNQSEFCLRSKLVTIPTTSGVFNRGDDVEGIAEHHKHARKQGFVDRTTAKCVFFVTGDTAEIIQITPK